MPPAPHSLSPAPHTPGPWHAHSFDGHSFEIRPAGSPVLLARVQGAANAGLIMAAPRLADALRIVLPVLRHEVPRTDQVQDAIDLVATVLADAGAAP